jgi:phage N-6-adenine-methyltransferase
MAHKRNGDIVTPKDEWETPPSLFKQLDDEFHFWLDAAASHTNSKIPERYFTKDDNALTAEWGTGDVWLNPPYSQGNVERFMTKAHLEGYRREPGHYVVCLVAIDASTGWWHNSVMHAKEIRFIKGRVKFIGYDDQGNAVNNSPTFSSCIVIFSNPSEWHETPDGDFRPYIGKTIVQGKE